MSRNEILAERLAAARKESGYTQDEIADFLRCSRVTVTNYENGRRSPDYDNLVLLAEKYNVTTDYLLGVTTAETTDKDLRYVCDYTGLTDKAVNTLHSIVLQSKGKLHSEKRKRDIEKSIEYVTNPFEELTQEEFKAECETFYFIECESLFSMNIEFNEVVSNTIADMLKNKFYSDKNNSFNSQQIEEWRKELFHSENICDFKRKLFNSEKMHKLEKSMFFSAEEMKKIENIFDEFKISREDFIRFEKEIIKSEKKKNELFKYLFDIELLDIKLDITADKEEANNAIYALNYLLEKKNISDFLIMIYLYLFVNIDTSKGKTLFGSVLSSIGSDDEMPIQIDTDVLSESFLIKINNYLNEWKCRGIKKVFDLEIGQGGGE